MTTETNDITKNYYNELISFLKATKEAFESSSPEFSPAKVLLSDCTTHVESCITELESLSGARFGDPSVGTKIYDGFATATAKLTSFFSGVGEHDDAKTLRDCFTNFQAASCGFQMLYTTEVSGYGETASSEILLGMIANHHKLVMRFSEVIPETVAYELSTEDDATFDVNHTALIVKKLKGTWS